MERLGTMEKLIAAFALGVVAGLALVWGYVLYLKDTIRVCTSYIHDRLDQQALALEHSRLCQRGYMKDKGNVFSATTQPQQEGKQRA
jgi:hypothetical protein